MTRDRKRLYLISVSILAVLLVALLIPNGSGRILVAILLLPSVLLTVLLVKKRVALSTSTPTVLLIVGMTGLLYVMFYFLSILRFGYTQTGYGMNAETILSYALPIGAIVVSTELIRHVLCAQKKKLVTAAAYLICLTADLIICGGIPTFDSFITFMDVVGLTFFPGLLYNLLYNYLTVRYGPAPNLVYRLLTVWLFYLIPYGSGIPKSLLAFVNMLLPIAIYLFIDALFERKRRYALGNTSRTARIASTILTAVVLVLMAGTVMLVSNQFKYGSLVIATESMTGELNKGDVAIFESYDDGPIQEGQIIVFEKGNSMVVHRVVDIKIINGNTRYYTKGDANEDMDAGFITAGDVVGFVEYKLPYVGYPTLWLRSLFKR